MAHIHPTLANPRVVTVRGLATEVEVLKVLEHGLPDEGVPNFDIVITDLDGERLAAIQVKTRRDYKGGDKGWHTKAKHEDLVSARMFYVFVDVGSNDDSAPSFFVMPSRLVAEACRFSHEIWLQTPGVNGRTRRDSDMRRLLPAYPRSDQMRLSKVQDEFMETHQEGWMEPYRSAWRLIGEEV